MSVRTCRACGCTDRRACPGGCHWVEKDLCSACVERPTPGPALMNLSDRAKAILRACAQATEQKPTLKYDRHFNLHLLNVSAIALEKKGLVARRAYRRDLGHGGWWITDKGREVLAALEKAESA